MQEVLNQIRDKHNQFSAAQRKVAAYVLENYAQIPFLSISVLAKNIGVSDNTIVKFCNQLGFDKFTEFKRVFSEYAHSELVMYNKVSETGDDLPENSFFAQTLENDISSIRSTLSAPENEENLPAFLRMVDAADRIYVTGGRTSAILAELFTNMLRLLGLKVYELNSGAGDYWDRLSMVDKKDLVIAFSFPRYTTQVVEALKVLHNGDIPVVLFTDPGLSPAQPYAGLTFHCAVASSCYFPCYSGCFALAEVLCRALAVSRKQPAAQHLRQLERLLLDRGTFTVR